MFCSCCGRTNEQLAGIMMRYREFNDGSKYWVCNSCFKLDGTDFHNLRHDHRGFHEWVLQERGKYPNEPLDIERYFGWRWQVFGHQTTYQIHDIVIVKTNDAVYGDLRLPGIVVGAYPRHHRGDSQVYEVEVMFPWSYSEHVYHSWTLRETEIEQGLSQFYIRKED